MGIHSGTAELRNGDYYGTTVNRAARLMAVAHGGQIVVSRATEELARDGEVDMLDLGDHALRDLGAAERIFQVVDPRLRRMSPPLRSASALSSNLPMQVTSFVGRDEESLRPRLFDEARLVTLATGGVGKSGWRSRSANTSQHGSRTVCGSASWAPSTTAAPCRR